MTAIVAAIAERPEKSGPAMLTNFLPAREPKRPFSRKPANGSAGINQRLFSIRTQKCRVPSAECRAQLACVSYAALGTRHSALFFSPPARGVPASAISLHERDPGSPQKTPDRAPNDVYRDCVLFLRPSVLRCPGT